MGGKLRLGKIQIDVQLKNIKNVHLSVHPPEGRVRIAAPARMKRETIRLYAISRLAWIKKQRRKILSQERESPRTFQDRESHYVWGKRYLLKTSEADAAPSVSLKHKWLHLRVRPGTSVAKKRATLDAWYREELQNAIPPLIEKWEPLLNVSVGGVLVRRMKTKWGSCNPTTRSIRLNTELARKPIEYLEYVIVHEMIHLRASTHNARFIALIDQHMPEWRFHREQLNRLPVDHQEWAS